MKINSKQFDSFELMRDLNLHLISATLNHNPMLRGHAQSLTDIDYAGPEPIQA